MCIVSMDSCRGWGETGIPAAIEDPAAVNDTLLRTTFSVTVTLQLISVNTYIHTYYTTTCIV